MLQEDLLPDPIPNLAKSTGLGSTRRVLTPNQQFAARCAVDIQPTTPFIKKEPLQLASNPAIAAAAQSMRDMLAKLSI